MKIKTILAVLAIASVASACGDDDDVPGSTADAGVDARPDDDAAPSNGTWVPVPGLDVENLHVAATWGTSLDNLWAVGEDRGPEGAPSANVQHLVAGAWTASNVPTFTVSSIIGFAADEVVVAARSLLVASDDAGWTTLSSLPGDHRDVWGESPDSLHVVSQGQNGRLLHWDGDTLAPVDLGVADPLLYTVGGRGNDVWVAGSTVFHAAGGAFAAVDAGLGENVTIRDLCVSDAGVVWLVGTSASVHRLVAGTWSKLDTGAPAATTFTGCLVVGDDLWITGDDRGTTGHIFHFDGTRWREELAHELTGVRNADLPVLSLGAGGGDVWAIDQAGHVLERAAR